MRQQVLARSGSGPRKVSAQRLSATCLLGIVLCVAGCGGSTTPRTSSTSGPSAADAKTIQAAQQNIVALCGAASDTAIKAAGGATSLEKDVTTLIAESKKYHDPSIGQASDAALRAGGAGKECGPSYADSIDVALLPSTARATVKAAGFPGFRGEDDTYYAAHYGHGEATSQRNCVTTAGEMGQNVEALENFLYLLNTGNPTAQHLLTTLQRECAQTGQ
jgi:hypothetical protein